jgi:hypothetical protein
VHVGADVQAGQDVFVVAWDPQQPPPARAVAETTPDLRRVDGAVRMTKPVLLTGGALVEGLRLASPAVT